ncbi:MAG: hypothetical protein KDB14_20220 [Planctomycetales bacterium]|nr:hypothetical protein [Planctomycetales bacterium]
MTDRQPSALGLTAQRITTHFKNFPIGNRVDKTAEKLPSIAPGKILEMPSFIC